MNTIFDWHRYNQFIIAFGVPLSFNSVSYIITSFIRLLLISILLGRKACVVFNIALVKSVYNIRQLGKSESVKSIAIKETYICHLLRSSCLTVSELFIIIYVLKS